MTPTLGLNVLLAGKPRPETKLQPAAARRSPVRAARPPLLLRWPQLTGIGEIRSCRTEPAPPSRRYGGGSNGCSTQATAYLRDTPPTRRESCAALGGRNRRCPHCATFPTDPSTDQCDRNPRCANGLMRKTTPGQAELPPAARERRALQPGAGAPFGAGIPGRVCGGGRDSWRAEHTAIQGCRQRLERETSGGGVESSERGCDGEAAGEEGRPALPHFAAQFPGDGNNGIHAERWRRRDGREDTGHESTRTTQLYNRVQDDVSLDEIERIHI